MVQHISGNRGAETHSYEEIRAEAFTILARAETRPRQFDDMRDEIAAIFRERETGERLHARLSANDATTFLQVFWDLFRQGVISLGSSDIQPNFPYFHVTELGKKIIDGNQPYFFSDVSGYTTIIRTAVPKIDEITLLYLQESMQAFQAGCLLSSAVMLGVAAEHTGII